MMWIVAAYEHGSIKAKLYGPFREGPKARQWANLHLKTQDWHVLHVVNPATVSAIGE